MALLKSKTFANVGITQTLVYTVPANIKQAKISEMIFSNKTKNDVHYSLYITKVGCDQVTIIPLTLLNGLERNAINMSTFINSGDNIYVQSDTASAIDVMISCVELD